MSKNSLTNFPRNDGFGAQLQTVLFTIMFCGLTGRDFFYSPFNKIAHNYDNDPDFELKKEQLIGIKDIFPIADNSIEYSGSYVYEYVENHLDLALKTELFSKVKDNFFKINNEQNRFKNNLTNVAVHFRNINKVDSFDYGYIALDYFKDVIEFIRKFEKGEKIFHIYSQGKEEDFKKLKNNDVVFHLNENVEDTFRDMVFADKLVTSKSSLSYSAALLSKGEIYYLPFWHRPASHWKVAALDF